jgi:medium-chain acyl-[acyl-carrier-protein] hydrolase
LFFFPFAGGGPSVFSSWFRELPDHMEGYVAHYPGRGSRFNEAPIRQLNTLVEKLFQALSPFLDGPFAFFGHSMGGLIAFELARQLRRKNLPQPTSLFISACGAPHVPGLLPPIHGLPDSEFVFSLQKLNGIPAEILGQPDTMELFLPILRADFEAVETHPHVPDETPLDCPLIAFGGLDDARVSRNQLEAWAMHTRSRFKAQYFPGDHFFINTARGPILDSITAEIKIPSHAKG